MNSPAVPTAPAPQTILRVPPHNVLNLVGKWKLTVPIDTNKDGKADEIKGAPLLTYIGEWCRTIDDQIIRRAVVEAGRPRPAVSFRAPVTGVTTPGSKNPRAELREQDGDEGAAWSSTDGLTHRLRVVEAFNRLPEGKPELVGAQIHDGSNDITVLRCEGSRLYFTHFDDDHFHLITDRYVLGNAFEVIFEVHDGVIDCYFNGHLEVTIPAPDLEDAYFKAGAYVQANPTKLDKKFVRPDNYGETLVWLADTSHVRASAPAAPGPVVTTPPVATAPAPSVPVTTPTGPPAGQAPAGPRKLRTVYVIRHAEKPARGLKGWDGMDEDDNSLTINGWARAGALVLLFGRNLGARFMRPGALVASKGKTKSNRPAQTLAPLAWMLGLTIDVSRDAEKDLSGMVVAIKKSQWLVTLVALEHSMIVKFLKAWGLIDVPWSDYPDRYDLVLVLSERADYTWSLRVDLMEAMAGDQVVSA